MYISSSVIEVHALIANKERRKNIYKYVNYVVSDHLRPELSSSKTGLSNGAEAKFPPLPFQVLFRKNDDTMDCHTVPVETHTSCNCGCDVDAAQCSKEQVRVTSQVNAVPHWCQSRC